MKLKYSVEINFQERKEEWKKFNNAVKKEIYKFHKENIERLLNSSLRQKRLGKFIVKVDDV